MRAIALQRFDDRFDVSVYAHFGKVFDHFAVRTDHDRAPDDPHRFLPVHILLAPGAIFLDGGARFVAQQLEIEVVFVAELLVRCEGVFADPEHRGTQLRELGGCVAKRLRFARAAWRIVSRVKINDDVLTFEIGEAPLAAGGRR